MRRADAIKRKKTVIADETIDRVRRDVRVTDVIGERVKLTKRGRSHLGLCPFHKEKTPSFHVSDERGFYHCFGCGASGDAIKFLREVDGLSFIEAVRAIAERHGIEIVETGTTEERQRHAETRKRRELLYTAGEVAAAYFERMLDEHPLAVIARKELSRRGLDGSSQSVAATLKAFRVGYAPYSWNSLSEHLREHGESIAAAEQVGLLVPRRSGAGHYDRFRHRLMFAVLDQEGRVIAFSGRALEEPDDRALAAAGCESAAAPGGQAAKYLNSPESPIYKKRETLFGLYQAKSAIRSEDRSVIVEGNFDVVSLHARGIQNAVAPLGTAFTAEQARQLRRFSQNVVLLFDADDAGRRAVRHAREACQEAGVAARVSTLPDGTDPDDFIRAHGDEALRRSIGAAQSLLEYLIGTTLDHGFAAADAESRARKIREVAELIAADDDPTVRALAERHADAIAERLGIADARTFRALASVVHRASCSAGTGRPPMAPPVPERARSRDRRIDIGIEIFGALLDFPELFAMRELSEAARALQGPPAAAIAAMRQANIDEVLKNPELLLAKVPSSIHPFAAARLAAPRHERVDDARSELLRNIEKLKRLELSRRKTEVMEELERVQATGDFDREMALLREQDRRARERHGL